MGMSVTTIKRLIRIAACLLCLPAVAQAEFGTGIVQDPVTLKLTYGVQKDWQEGIEFHPETGNYIVTYKDSYDSFNSLVFEPATKIAPTLKSRFKLSRGGLAVNYEYKLKNGKSAKQNIRTLVAKVTNLNPGSPMAPPNWEGRAVPSIVDPTLRLGWVYGGTYPGGLAPGKSIQGFVVESDDLPGIGMIRITGAARATTWLGHSPPIDTEVGKQLYELEKNNFVPHPAAVPKIVVPTPFDAAVVLDNLRAHITQDIVELKLIEPTFAAQLDRTLEAAAETVRRNQQKAARDLLHEAFKLVHRAHPGLDRDDWEDEEGKPQDKARSVHPIDRLAARVIAFDLKYLEHRLRSDRDKE